MRADHDADRVQLLRLLDDHFGRVARETERVHAHALLRNGGFERGELTLDHGLHRRKQSGVGPSLHI